jgi:FAD/FMN-containing dehydrogenase
VILPSVSSSLLSDLRTLLGHERVLSDDFQRKAYSYDAGIHRVWPEAVVLPESAEELSKVVLYARKNGIPLTPRSAGTNLTGAAIGPGIVVGLTRMNWIEEGSLEEGTVRTGPGVILKELSDRLARRGYFFPPDPSSAQACQIGGMIGTNAAGAHALKYGAMKDNVRGISFMDDEGALHALAPVSWKSWEELEGRMPVRGFREVVRHLPEWSPLLLSRMRHVSKNSSGYNLFDLALARDEAIRTGKGGIFDPVRLIVGSEGTLGFVTEATLAVRPLPKRRVTLLAYFLTLSDLGAAVGEILPLSPSALEMMDRATLDLIGRARFGIPAEADSLLLIEFDSEPQEELIASSRAILARYPSPVPLQVAVDPDHQKAL